MKLSLSILVLVTMAGSAFAGGSWRDKVSYRYASSTSLKVVEPDGLKVTVTTAAETKSATIPELFALPDRDAFVTVTITAADGTRWTKKVEVRAKQQTELSVVFTPDAPPAAEPTHQRTNFGKLMNRAGGCNRSWNAIKADFVDAEGRVARTAQVDNGKTADVELVGGKFDVRIWVWLDNAWSRILTSPGHELTKDGWVLGFGCPSGSRTPALLDGSKR